MAPLRPLAFAALAVPATACAQAAAVRDMPPAAVITVAGHYDNAVGTSDAASHGAIYADLLAARPALRTGELLEFVPGMIVTQHSGDGKANQYFLRGFNLDHGTDFATHVDGMPANMRSHAHGQGYTDVNFLIPELVQRIDYRKGPYFAGDGDFSSAGSARFRLFNQLPQDLASATAGSNGYRRALLAGSTNGAGGALLYALDLGRNDGPWDVPERLRKANAVLRYSAARGGGNFTITGMAYTSHWNATDQVPQRAVDAGLIGRYGSLAPTDGGSTSRFSLSSTLHQRSGAALLEADAYVVRSMLDLYSDFTYRLDDTERGDQFNQRERRTMAGASASLAWPGTLGGIALRNKAGVQLRQDWLSPVGLYHTQQRVRLDTVREDRVREGSAAVYGESSVQWQPWLRTVAGLRYDAYRFHANGSEAGGNRFSPKLSLIAGPWDSTEYFFNIGKGFHSNDARGVVARAAGATPLAATRGMELGLRTEIIPGLQSSLALWRLQLDSELVFAGDAGDTEAARASRRHGIEWNNHYVAVPGLLFDLDVAASSARYAGHDPAGSHIPGALNKVVSFGATVNRATWFGAFNLRYFGPRPLVENNSVRSASSTLAYARAGYQFNAKTRLTVDIFNLFNRRGSDIDYYYASRLPGEADGGVEDRHFHPVEPRSWRVTLARQF
ncbi:TonB-dependent receptor [Pseudoduganella ginsengisoli]|uniref:TonB-dependent receptor plug domain-containing protein n=1 Tax=Pseudoduganella ginsengisoli TaxID=1462440 RepID=A0A6L6PVG9_9BURK|nr:TonB-dependent receptor [Pseudoduganella ginsengisoli]MTW01435.1 TonB-dependent receptor plug domain-containing protein [Pseudoduganella ginsengisoli]